jgi:hypothetical protein
MTTHPHPDSCGQAKSRRVISFELYARCSHQEPKSVSWNPGPNRRNLCNRPALSGSGMCVAESVEAGSEAGVRFGCRLSPVEVASYTFILSTDSPFPPLRYIASDVKTSGTPYGDPKPRVYSTQTSLAFVADSA